MIDSNNMLWLFVFSVSCLLVRTLEHSVKFSWTSSLQLKMWVDHFMYIISR